MNYPMTLRDRCHRLHDRLDSAVGITRGLGGIQPLSLTLREAEAVLEALELLDTYVWHERSMAVDPWKWPQPGEPHDASR